MVAKSERCPVCGKGAMKPATVHEEMFGVDLGDYPGMKCSRCGETFVQGDGLGAIRARAEKLGLWGLASQVERGSHRPPTSADPITSIHVHESTRKLLEARKMGGQSYDEVVRDLIEQYVMEVELPKLAREVKGGRRSIPLERTRRRLGI
jgi:YgiT-type zinc finger domain-containing protein